MAFADEWRVPTDEGAQEEGTFGGKKRVVREKDPARETSAAWRLPLNGPSGQRIIALALSLIPLVLNPLGCKAKACLRTRLCFYGAIGGVRRVPLCGTIARFARLPAFGGGSCLRTAHKCSLALRS